MNTEKIGSGVWGKGGDRGSTIDSAGERGRGMHTENRGQWARGWESKLTMVGRLLCTGSASLPWIAAGGGSGV